MSVGLWGQMWLDALQHAQPRLYLELQMRGELEARATEVDDEASASYEATLTALRVRNPEPKGSLAMMQHFRVLQNMARELTLDAILPVDEETQRANAGNGGYTDEDESG